MSESYFPEVLGILPFPQPLEVLHCTRIFSISSYKDAPAVLWLSEGIAEERPIGSVYTPLIAASPVNIQTDVDDRIELRVGEEDSVKEEVADTSKLERRST